MWRNNNYIDYEHFKNYKRIRKLLLEAKTDYHVTIYLFIHSASIYYNLRMQRKLLVNI